jgi:hypothetical protein
MSSKKNDPPRRTPEELWKALEELADTDEAERIHALSDEDLDAELRADGLDPTNVRAEGSAFVKALFDRRDRETAAARAIEAREARLEARAARRGTLSRDELVTRIGLAAHDPRLEEKMAVGFRNRDTAAATVAELESMLEEMEELLDGATGAGEGKPS